MNYIKSSAFAKKVTLKGNTIEQYEPIGEYNTAKKLATEARNKSQYKPKFFFFISMLKFFANIRKFLIDEIAIRTATLLEFIILK